MEKIDILKRFLEGQKLMTVATLQNQVWCANVYFVHNDELTLYFISGKDSLHSRNIGSNPCVSFSTASFDEKKPFEHRKGIQGIGVCGEIKKQEEIDIALKLFKESFK